MNFKEFCEDEKIYLGIFREYRNILLNSQKNFKTQTLNKPKIEVKCEKGFYGNPKDPIKDDFKKFECNYKKHLDPYIEKTGARTFCDKCNGSTSEEYLNTKRYRNKSAPVKKPVIPEHLLGRIPRRKSDSSSSSSESEIIEKPMKNEILYKIIVKTDSNIESGTTAPVFIRFVDGNKKSPPIQLKKNLGSLKFYFAPNSKETFHVRRDPISDMKTVNIKIVPQNEKDEWLPEWISIEEMNGEKRKWHCKIGKFLSGNRKDCELFYKLKPVRDTVPVIKYQVKIKVSEDSVDECCGILSIILLGSLKKTESLLLQNYKSAKIKKGTTAMFSVEHEEVGFIKAIHVEISSSSREQDLLKTPEDSKNSKKNSIRKGWEDIKIESVIIVWIDSDKKPHEVEFLCNKWIGLSDKMTKKSILLKDPIENKITTSKNENSKLEKEEETTYKITFFTSKKTLGGTDATVYAKIYGKKGIWTDPFKFKDYDKKLFESGSEDSFTVNGKNVGSVLKINVWHNKKGFASGWKLEKISVIRHLTPFEICETLEQMKKRSTLPKEIKLHDGKVFVNENIKKDQNDTSQNYSPTKIEKSGKKPNAHSYDSSSSDSIEKSKPTKSSNNTNNTEKINIKNTHLFNLPYAEESNFLCQHWLSENNGKDSVNQILTSESNSLLYSPINLQLNPEK